MSSLAPQPDAASNPATQIVRSRYVAFEGHRLVASGELDLVARRAKEQWDRGGTASVLIFDQETSEIAGIDFSGTQEQFADRLAVHKELREAAPISDVPEKRGPGRPRLGVIGREVTLLPRHWSWLDEQPGGASVALRKLVEAAKRSNQAQDQARKSQEAVHRFMYAMAGDLPGFEEASRAFYRGERDHFIALIEPWPKDVRDHLTRLAETAFRLRTQKLTLTTDATGREPGVSQ